MLAELAYPGAKVFALGQVLDGAGVTLAALVRDVVAPPVELGLGPLEGEEDDDAGDGDAAGWDGILLEFGVYLGLF